MASAAPHPLLPRLRTTAERLRARSHDAPIWLAVPALAMVLRLVVAQAGTLVLPIQGEHGWREAVTYSVAYNFTHESFDFFHPRLDITRGRTGINGMEAPVVPFAIGAAMRLFGDAPAVGRVVVWLSGLAGLAAMLGLLRRFRSPALLVAFPLAFFLSPMALFELRQIQPDGVAEMLSAASALFFLRFAEHERRRDYALGMLLFTLGVLAKGPALVLAPAMWWFACADRSLSTRELARRAAPFVVPAALLVAWAAWAHHLTSAFGGGVGEVAIDLDTKRILREAGNQDALGNLFGFVYSSYVSNWVLFPALLAGIVLAMEPPTRRVSAAFLAWLLLGSIYLASYSWRLYTHMYYADIVLVPVTYFTAFALAAVVRLFSRETRAPPVVASWSAVVVLISLAAARFVGGPAKELSDVVEAADPHPESSWMSTWHLVLLLCLVLGAMLVAAQVSKSVLRWASVLLLPVAAFVGIGRADHDAREVLRWRARTFETAQWKERWIGTLRPLVDRYSTRADLFVVDNNNPFWLYLPLRKGWTTEVDELEDSSFFEYRQAGARFFLSYNDRSPPRRMRSPLLGATPYFKLYCLDENGCSPIR
jgi:hypothetical protein